MANITAVLSVLKLDIQEAAGRSFQCAGQDAGIEVAVHATLSSTNFTRGHNFKLFKSRSKLLVGSNFFINCIINQWNSLPPSVINAQSISVFKNRLDRYWTQLRYGHNERPVQQVGLLHPYYS